MMELLQSRHEQESIRSDVSAALAAIRELPSVIARKGEGAAAMWGPDGGDLFEQVRRGQGGWGRRKGAMWAAVTKARATRPGRAGEGAGRCVRPPGAGRTGTLSWRWAAPDPSLAGFWTSVRTGDSLKSARHDPGRAWRGGAGATVQGL